VAASRPELLHLDAPLLKRPYFFVVLSFDHLATCVLFTEIAGGHVERRDSSVVSKKDCLVVPKERARSRSLVSKGTTRSAPVRAFVAVGCLQCHAPPAFTRSGSFSKLTKAAGAAEARSEVSKFWEAATVRPQAGGKTPSRYSQRGLCVAFTTCAAIANAAALQ